MSGIKELEQEYNSTTFLVWWKAVELQSYIKHIGSDKELEDWAICKMQAGMKCIQALEKKKVDLMKTDLGQICIRKQEERKKSELIEKEVDSCLKCLAFRNAVFVV
jgi:hypothetical protein